jgi:hypothetical protein
MEVCCSKSFGMKGLKSAPAHDAQFASRIVKSSGSSEFAGQFNPENCRHQ